MPPFYEQQHLEIPILCGKTVCGAEPGHYCSFFGTINYNYNSEIVTIPVCNLFPTTLEAHTKLEVGDNNRVLRCKACISFEQIL